MINSGIKIIREPFLQKMDNNFLKLIEKPSFMRIMDPSTILPEENPSFEDEVEGEEAKQLFYSKGKKICRLAES